MLQRVDVNPILQPDKNLAFASHAVFNPSVVSTDAGFVMLYRAMGEEQIRYNRSLRLSVIGRAESQDGIHFHNMQPLLEPQEAWEKFGCEDPRVTFLEGKYYIFYTALSQYPPSFRSIRVAVAVSDDLRTIQKRKLVTPFNAKAMTLFPEKIAGKYTVILTVNTDKPPAAVAYAQFEELETLFNMNFWNRWYTHFEDFIIPLKRVNSDGLEVGAPPIKTTAGWLLIHSYIKNYLNSSLKPEFRIEAALLDLQQPAKVIGRVENALLKAEASYETEGQVKDVVFPESAAVVNQQLRVYYGGADSVCCLAQAPLEQIMAQMEINTPITLKCQKFLHNPILQAIPTHPWEAQAVFNPAALELEDTTYILYRTTGADNLSYLGLAISQDGYLIDERLTEPIYPFRSEFEKPRQAGHAAGCEDPRLTVIGDQISMLYTAFDGQLPRLALTSISVADFLARRWTAWRLPQIISPPGVADKDGMLFPEKIQGRYVIFHRIEPNICIDYVDSLDFAEGHFLDSEGGMIPPRMHSWDNVKIGINTPPLKTPEGWLVFYHGISQIDRHYRLGALLLDLVHVDQVLGRTPYPILEPELPFETKGIVENVVFPCGVIRRGDELFLYYGGADKVTCGATISQSRLLEYLRKSANKKYLIYQ